AFVQLIESVRTDGPVRAILEEVYKRSGLEDVLKKLDPDEESEVPNVDELISSAAEFDSERTDGTLAEYLAAVSLVSDVDRFEGGEGAVTLMTLHAAKGLEFPVVAIIGLEEGCLPHSRARENVKEMEEERRLCFVGITRAQERLILSNASRRAIRGVYEYTIPSPFLGEMPGEMMEVIESVADSRGRYEDRSFSQRRQGAYRSSFQRRF
ncbi:MAG TPA: 3'-5' exonuclease, partial [Tepidisphaeraceae bacterium]|nr:3'-5' exonuclease [Tepidisphaeraceae bacterium]